MNKFDFNQRNRKIAISFACDGWEQIAGHDVTQMGLEARRRSQRIEEGSGGKGGA
jgi:hypothetical protein